MPCNLVAFQRKMLLSSSSRAEMQKLSRNQACDAACKWNAYVREIVMRHFITELSHSRLLWDFALHTVSSTCPATHAPASAKSSHLLLCGQQVKSCGCCLLACMGP
jgi:hypothetical protein